MRSAIKIKEDTAFWQKKYPSRIFQAEKGFIEPYHKSESEDEQKPDKPNVDLPRPSEVVKMFQPPMSFENESNSDYR